jgi:hypothetical protein
MGYNLNVTKVNSNLVELIVYSRLVEEMTSKNFTPHVMLSQFSYECRNFNKENLEKDKREIFNYYEEHLDKLFGSKSFDPHVLNVNVLELAKGDLFYDWRKKKHSEEEWLSITFQIVWTLEVFRQFGLIHNDFHDNNIFLEKLETPLKMIYFLDKKTYFVVPVHYLVKIFDFDRSTIQPTKDPFEPSVPEYTKSLMGTISERVYDTLYVPKTSKNEKNETRWKPLGLVNRRDMQTYEMDLYQPKSLFIDPKTGSLDNTILSYHEYCQNSGQCNLYNPFFDLFYFLWAIHNGKQAYSHPVMTKFIKGVFYNSTKLLETPFEYRGMLCIPDKKEKENCTPYIPDRNKEMKTSLMILKTQFDMFIHQLPQYDPKYLPFESGYPHVFLLPNLYVDNQRFFDTLDETTIKPIVF